MTNEKQTPAATPIPAKRTKSNETVLKEDMRSIARELKALDKKITDFETLETEMTNVEADRSKLKAELDTVKNKLIKELGLD